MSSCLLPSWSILAADGGGDADCCCSSGLSPNALFVTRSEMPANFTLDVSSNQEQQSCAAATRPPSLLPPPHSSSTSTLTSTSAPISAPANASVLFLLIRLLYVCRPIHIEEAIYIYV